MGPEWRLLSFPWRKRSFAPEMKDQSDLLERKLDTLDPKDRDNLLRLRSRLKSAEVTPDAVGGVLPEAVLIGEAENRRLSKSMVEVTERSIETSVLKDPTVLSTALFPIIGSAIRKAINKLLADTVANMNAGLEKHGLLPKAGLALRVLAHRRSLPGDSPAQHPPVRVEHVFLIHRKTGILLRGLSLEGSRTADDDMVASMLTAVKDYIRDSLSLPQAEAVEGISAGEHSLLAEEGPRASMAVIVRGAPDGGLRTAMQDALESIHLRLSRELESFSGDTAPFEACDPYLRSCLISQEKSEGRAKRCTPSSSCPCSPRRFWERACSARLPSPAVSPSPGRFPASRG
jgi:OOP family OmpA-OmpF porin